MKIRTTEYFIKEVLHSLKRNNWMSIASIGTVTVSLFIFGMFLMLVMNMNKMADNLESQMQINVYLEESVTRSEAMELGDRIKSLQGIEKVTFVSREEAMERFKERLGDQQSLLEALDDTNPLPDSFEVFVSEVELVKSTADKLESMEGVEIAKYGQDVIEHLYELTKMIRLFGFSLMVVLALATLFIIANTIRLTVFARRKEIAIMKYVGATDWFIRWPFVLEGMLLGMLGGIVAAVVLRFSYGLVVNSVYDVLAFFPLIEEQPFLNYITVIIIFAGIGIGAIGSALSLKRFLKV